MTTYMVKKVFGPVVQGEGSRAGEPCVFVRLAGCDMWDGRAATKAASRCPYCDTDFRGGERMSADAVAMRAHQLLPKGGLCVVSGGEPLLQLDEQFTDALRAAAFMVAVETNGAHAIDFRLGQKLAHVSMSPKVPRSEIALRGCDDLKVLFPHPNPAITPEAFSGFPAGVRFIQPVNEVDELSPANMARALEECLRLQREKGETWRLSIQTHKLLGVE